MRLLVIFFFKQKTAYEMRISDWSSDVCSSDLQFLFSRHHRLQYPAYERSIDRQSGLHRSSSKGELRRSQRFLLTTDFDQLLPFSSQFGFPNCRPSDRKSVV